MDTQFRCRRVKNPTSAHRTGFVATYKQAFGREPYKEVHADEDVVANVWEPHLESGMIMIVTDESAAGKMVGFGCAMPFGKAPADVRGFLEQLANQNRLPAQFDYQNAWYMSELGVADSYLRRGAAWELVKQRMVLINRTGASQFFMRTAATGSNSKPMYLKMGSHELADLHDTRGPEQSTPSQSPSDHRVYLWGNVRETASNIARIQNERDHISFVMDDEDELDNLIYPAKLARI